MLKTSVMKENIRNGKYDDTLRMLYHDGIERQKERYIKAIESFETLFGADREIIIATAPGRSELSGNHTDHQNGCVMATAVTVDNLAIASPSGNAVVNVKSEGYDADIIDISDLSIKGEEANRSSALIRGIAAWFQNHGYAIGGLDAYTVSDVPKGSGLSSSACFEVLVGNILAGLFNNDDVPALDIARAGRFAENTYFMKPSGFMDQTASSYGGIISIDFKDGNNPKIKEVDSSILDHDYTLVVVNTGDNHADLSDQYAAIPIEMREVAAYFGKTVLREVEETDFYESLGALRKSVSDRAILRAHHFFSENRRVAEQIDALVNRDMARFAELTRASGRSSSVYLQNIYPENNKEERGVALALAISEWYLGEKGAYRVHGGGFAGTILSIVPNDMTDGYIDQMEELFGKNCCYRLAVRPVGGYCIRE